MEWRSRKANGVANHDWNPQIARILVILGTALALASPAQAQNGSNGAVCSQQNGHHGLHFLKDFQYYKPMVANIRNPRLQVSHYTDDAVPFTQRGPEGSKHSTFGFFDVAYGGHFPFLGWNFDREAPENCMEANGIAMFVQGSAHALLDMDTESHSVLNTDFRIGAGFQARFARHLSMRLQYFHESSHIGDEYVLDAIDNAAFRRYNVSYEAWEGYLSADNFQHQDDLDGRLSLIPVYSRLYGGGRWFVSGLRGTFDNEFEAFDLGAGVPVGEPLLVEHSNEFQFGGELFWDCFELPEDRPDESALKRLIHPQYIFVAGDMYYRDRYDITTPERVPSLHLMLGATYGAYFRGRRSVQWALHLYDGVNPHGQFRTNEIEYVALSFGLRF